VGEIESATTAGALSLRSGKGSVPNASMRRKRKDALVDEHNDAACAMIRVSGHGPCDLQSSPLLFLPAACVPPALRRSLAVGDETVCFFMSWSASLSDRWHDEVSRDVRHVKCDV
jgi:hypothetical protein